MYIFIDTVKLELLNKRTIAQIIKIELIFFLNFSIFMNFFYNIFLKIRFRVALAILIFLKIFKIKLNFFIKQFFLGNF